MQKLWPKTSKKSIFFETSIWKGFWIGFGRVLGSQKPRFSHFFRCFFDVIFEARFEEAKNRKKSRQQHRRQNFGAGLRWGGSSWGEKKRGVARSVLRYQNLDAEHSAKILLNLAYLAFCNPARFAPPTVGGGLKTPRGDHRRPPTFGFGRSGEAILTLGVLGVVGVLGI